MSDSRAPTALATAPTLDRVVAHEGFPVFEIGQDYDDYQRRVQAAAERFQRQGVTHIKLNDAFCSLPWTMDPANSYLRFTEFGYPLNQFVSTRYDTDMYYSKFMAMNRKLLLHQAQLARDFGFRGYVMCVEPSFMQESFFERHPAFRGPRVDNPSCSTKPLYAMCVMLQEVQDYYGQIIRKTLDLVPEIDEFHIFTNDTGAGFCYSSHLYCGPNGPYHCKETSPGKHAQVFARTLLDAARPINPDFRVVMTSGLGPQEKIDYIQGAGEGLSASVYGAFAWMGGLEDYWGSLAIGPDAWKDPEARQRVRRWQRDDMQARFKPLREQGSRIYVSYSPLYYRDDDPRPFETHRITCDLLTWGMTDLIGGAPGGEFSVNGAVMRHAFSHGVAQTDQVVREVAEGWVGDAMADELVRAWRLCDRASCDQPMPTPSGHCMMAQPMVKHYPLIPDDEALAEGDLDYFLTPAMRDQFAMPGYQGSMWRIFYHEESLLRDYIDQYAQNTLPDYEAALQIVDQLHTEAGDETARRCLEAQRDMLTNLIRAHRYLYAWMIGAIHKLAHCTVTPDLPSFDDAVQVQLDLSDALKLDARRKALMIRHRSDALRPIDLSGHPFNRHPGTEGWEGAHEKVMH